MVFLALSSSVCSTPHYRTSSHPVYPLQPPPRFRPDPPRVKSGHRHGLPICAGDASPRLERLNRYDAKRYVMSQAEASKRDEELEARFEAEALPLLSGLYSAAFRLTR